MDQEGCAEEQPHPQAHLDVQEQQHQPSAGGGAGEGAAPSRRSAIPAVTFETIHT